MHEIPQPWEARVKEQVAFIQELLNNHGHEVDEIIVVDGYRYPDECTPLNIAMTNGSDDKSGEADPYVVKVLLEAGADPEHRGIQGESPLLSAVYRFLNEENPALDRSETGDAWHIVKLLLEYGARLDTKNSIGYMPILVSARYAFQHGIDSGSGRLFRFLVHLSSPENMTDACFEEVCHYLAPKQEFLRLLEAEKGRLQQVIAERYVVVLS